MVNEQKQTPLISITELRNHVFKLQQDLEQALLNHANELIRDGMQIEYRCINPDWAKTAFKLLETQGFSVVYSEGDLLLLKISVQ